MSIQLGKTIFAIFTNEISNYYTDMAFLNKSYFVILLLLTSNFLFSNFSKIEELEKNLDKFPNIKKVKVLNKLAQEYWFKSDEKVLKYGQQALKLSKLLKNKKQGMYALGHIAFAKAKLNNYEEAKKYAKKSLFIAENLNYIKGIVFALQVNGEIYARLNNYNKSLGIYLRLLKIQNKMENKESIAKTLFLIGVCYQELGNKLKALETYEKSLGLYSQIGNKLEVANSLRYIGSVYEDLGEYGKTSQYYFKSLKMFEEIGDIKMIAVSFKWLGKLYYSWRDKKKAIDYLKKSLKLYERINDKFNIIYLLQAIGLAYQKIEEYDKAIQYYQKSIDIAKPKKNSSKYYIRTVYENQGHIFKRKKIYNSALYYYNKALDMNEIVKDKLSSALINREIGEIYLKLGRYKIALNNLKKSLKHFENTKNTDALIKIYNDLNIIYFKMKNYREAYKYKDLYALLKDKTFKKENSEKIAEMQAKYETEKKERENQLLKKDNEIQKLAIDKQKVILYIFIIGIILVLLVLTFAINKLIPLLKFWKKKNIVGRKYKFMDKIASGGMGVVYKAHDIRDKKKIYAVKLLRDDLLEDPRYKRRFEHEAIMADVIKHPNIVRVYERGGGEKDESLYIAMEYIQGKNLSKLMKEEKLKISTIINIIKQVIDALATIHKKNIIHRDIKPENIMIAKTEENPHFVKILDFGLARMDALTRFTQTQTLLGTFSYISPEQILNENISTKSDIYSTGIIFYEMMCGENPFYGDNDSIVIKNILNIDPVPVINIRNDIPAEINNLVMSMLIKDPLERPKTQDVLETLNELNILEG